MGTNAYLAHSYSSAATDASKLAVIVKRVGTPDGTLHIEVYSDSGGSPNASIAVGALTTTIVTDTISQLREVDLASHIAGGGATSYWVVVHQYGGTATTSNHWEVGTNPDSASNTKCSSNGTTWAAATQELYCRVLDTVGHRFRYFEYKRVVYALDTSETASDGRNANLFMNGDRGAADANTAPNKSFLIDATKSWTADEWIGCTVLIIKGPGAADRQPWRTITDNSATTLSVSPAWETEHTTATEYVILGSNKWTQKTGLLNHTFTDIAVADDIVYFACDNDYLLRYNECDYNGVWTVSSVHEGTAMANKLCAIHSPTGWELWGSLDAYQKTGARVWKASVPPIYSATSDLYGIVSVLDDGKGVWDEQVVSGITVSQHDYGMKIDASAGYGGGLVVDACSKAIDAIDITKGTKIGMMIMSSIEQDAGDLKLKLDDTQLLKRTYLPDSVWHYDTEVLPSDVVKHRAYNKPTSVIYFDASEHGTADKGWHTISNLFDGEATNIYQITWIGTATVDFLYVSYPETIW